jgi:hypothetical protein
MGVFRPNGYVIPAHPLALTPERKLDEKYQRALTRYYRDAGAGGIAVGVHTTQFAIRDPRHGLYRPVLELAAETIDNEPARRPEGLFLKIAGLCGRTPQAVAEAEAARSLGYHNGLLSLGAWLEDEEAVLLNHCRIVSEVMPIIGFYLQPAVGGRVLPYRFWRKFAEIENVIAIKIAPFNRYQTLDVIRAVVDSGRHDIALYTGNDDNILIDLLTKYEFPREGEPVVKRFSGGLLGQWAVWTRRAVEMMQQIHEHRVSRSLDAAWLTLSAHLTDANGALFDAAHHYAGCIAGIHEVLRRQGLMRGTWCLDPNEGLSPGQMGEIDRVLRDYPELNDDAFVAEHRDTWLKG